MKFYKPILLLIIVFLLQSCKKNYSCLCTITFESPGYYPFVTSTVKEIDQKTTKKRAETICSYTEKQLYSNTSDYKNPSEKLTVVCAVK